VPESEPESVGVVAAVALVLLSESRHRSSHDKLPTCSRGFSHILHWRPNLGTADSHRSTAAVPESVGVVAAVGVVVGVVPVWSKHHSSEHSIPA